MSTSDSSKPLNVSIVDFEASQVKTEIGAGLAVSSNSARVLNHLEVCRDNLKDTPYSGVRLWSSMLKLEKERKRVGQPQVQIKTPSSSRISKQGFFVHRSDLYEELKRLATGDGEGPPANLRLGSKVLECDPEEGTVTLNSGEVVHADLILGADGIHSVIRTHVVGSVQKASDSGWSCFRAVFEPTMALEDIPELQWFTSGAPGARAVVAKDEQFRMFLFYPIRSGTLINFVGFFTESQDAAQGLLGDAAHATLPLLGMGAAMAIEEGGALGCLFPAGTRREDIPARLQAYQDIRKTRGDFVKTQSVEQVSRLVHGGPAQFLMTQKIQSYLVEYDAIGAAQECYDERFGAK
ncbi:hypothetical protein B0H19DRAFT_1229936 [Mycena capillaripes]|nr:hypothetical protein B0H19DRAFT_1229936 [Mycena capillaripes]